jgi:type II secretory pathway component PulK
MKHRNPTQHRRGMVLVIVAIVVAMISLAGLAFVTTVHVEGKGVRLQADHLQLEHVAGSGTELVKAFFEQPAGVQREAGGSWDNPGRFRNVLVLDDEDTGRRARFSVVAPADGDSVPGGIRFGVENESARLNLGVLLSWDERAPGSAHQALMSLPGMTDAVADAILDWIDPDSTPRPFGAEAEYYQGLGVPYAPRNGVPQCLEELLLVRGVTRSMLFGPDANFNHRVEPAQRRLGAGPATSRFASQGPPWASLLTVSSAERNQSDAGQPRIHLNQPNLAALHEALAKAFEPAWADFIVLYRQHGPYAGSEAGEPLRARGSVLVDLTQPPTVSLDSVLDLVDAKVQIPAASGRPTQVIASPFASDAASMRDYLPKLMDRTSAVGDAVIYGRVNVNLAPREVLRAVPGLDAATVDQILAARGPAAGHDLFERRHATWLLAEGLVDLARMKALLPYLAGSGDVVRAQVIASFDRAGPARRAEFLVDATANPPRQVYWKDLRLLGQSYPTETRFTP